MALTDPFNPPEDYTFDWNPDFTSGAGQPSNNPSTGGNVTGTSTVSARIADQRFAEYANNYPEDGLPTTRGLARLTSAGKLMFIDQSGEVSVWIKED